MRHSSSDTLYGFVKEIWMCAAYTMAERSNMASKDAGRNGLHAPGACGWLPVLMAAATG